jgi:hypothetical protein
VGEEERKYNKHQEAAGEVVRKRLTKAAGKLMEGAEKGEGRSLVEEEKNELLRKYIDIFNNTQVREK